MEKDKSALIWILIAVILAIFLFGNFGMSGYGMMGNLNYGFGGMWIFGFLFMTLILVALILFILWLVKQLQNDNKRK